MDKKLLAELNRFLGKATLATYAGSGPEADPEEAGFKELEYKEGKWDYKDSYSGFFQSWGRETVWLNGNPVWAQLYGGGMVKKFQHHKDFAHTTFDFLKKALSAGEKQEKFQPRGPKKFAIENWKYTCAWKGNISDFKGNEKIIFKGKIVFTHYFFGGLIVSK